MAVQRYTIDGFGQLELNNVAFRRDGRVEAQCELDADDFETVPAENGMALIVDKANHVVRFIDADEKLNTIALNYSSEHLYDEQHLGLKNFRLMRGEMYPRMGYLSVADLFTTNCVCYDTEDFDDDDAVNTALVPATLKATPMYAQPSDNGAWQLVAEMPESGCFAQVIKKTTMPDGTWAVQLQVIAL